MEFVTTTIGARSLIFEDYRYVINRSGRNDSIFWRCAKSRSCSGSLTTIKSEIISSRAGEHTHPPNGAEMTACKTVEMMKTRVKESLDPIPAVYQQQLVEVSASEICTK